MTDELMKRPTERDAYVKRRAAELYLPSVLQWLGYESSPECQEVRDIADTLMRVVSPGRNGYEMARELDDLGWATGERAVELMGECSDHFRAALDELTWQWVRCLNVRPRFKVGDAVALPPHYRNTDGVVVGIEEKQARYRVHTVDQKPNAYYLVDFECVSKQPIELTTCSVQRGAGRELGL